MDPFNSLQATLRGVTISSLCLTTLFVGIRLQCRRKAGQYLLEDYFHSIAHFLNTAASALIIVQQSQGIANLNLINSSENTVTVLKEAFALDLIYIGVIWLAKVAIILHILSIFAPTKSGAVFQVGRALIWITSLVYSGSALAVATRCMPVEKIWNPEIPGSCAGRNLILIVTGAINVTLNILIFVLPLWALRRRKAKTIYRKSAMAVFVVAWLAILASAGRAISATSFDSELSGSHNLFKIDIWTVAETGLLIICPNLLFLPIILEAFRQKRRRTDDVDIEKHQTATEPQSDTTCELPIRSMCELPSSSLSELQADDVRTKM